MKILITLFLIGMLSGQHSTIFQAEKKTSITGVTKSDEAQMDFDRGLLLLHNFEYPDARSLFQQAQKKDPLFGIAYWGEAMTYNHPVWHNQDISGAREVLTKFTALVPQKNIHLSALDAELLKSLDILYGEGKKNIRDKNYAEFMKVLSGQYKDNHDVTAFYALSLLGMAVGWDAELCNEAAALSASVLKENPKHPGALHYYIHAEDHPEYAELALQQANDYAQVASYSGHALHMPSHIYLALGHWDDVVKSNEISWKAGVDRKETKKLNNDAHNYHGHWWLEYGYLQQGRFSRAFEILKTQRQLTRELPSERARHHYVIMKGHYLVETNDWENRIVHEDVEIKDLSIETRALHYFLKGLMAFKKNDVESLKTIVRQIGTTVDNSKQLKLAEEGITICKAGVGSPGQAGINQAAILREQLNGLLAFLQKDVSVAKKHFEQAISMEEEMGYFYGPPEILKPTYEFYGEFLLAINEPEAAHDNFAMALLKAPGRSQSLRGLIEAAKRSGVSDKSVGMEKQLAKNLLYADSKKLKTFFAKN